MLMLNYVNYVRIIKLIINSTYNRIRETVKKIHHLRKKRQKENVVSVNKGY